MLSNKLKMTSETSDLSFTCNYVTSFDILCVKVIDFEKNVVCENSTIVHEFQISWTIEKLCADNRCPLTNVHKSPKTRTFFKDFKDKINSIP